MRRSTHDERSQTRATALTLLDAPTLDQQQALALVGGKTERVNELAPEVVATQTASTFGGWLGGCAALIHPTPEAKLNGIGA